MDSLNATDRSKFALYCAGIFTTVRIQRGMALLWEKHWRRLNHDAAVLGIDLAQHPIDRVRCELDAALTAADLKNGRARITFSDRSHAELWPSPHEHGTHMSIVTGEFRPVPRPFKLATSPYLVNSRSPLAGVKSCNYLENVLAKDDAKQRGFHEAIRLNERGLITGACMANLFWLSNGRLCTPALSTGCLPGTTREFVLENLDGEEVEAQIGELEKADAIFLTSAGLGIVQVAEFDARTMPKLEHPITDLLLGTR